MYGFAARRTGKEHFPVLQFLDLLAWMPGLSLDLLR